MARPIPREAPVMRAKRPSSRRHWLVMMRPVSRSFDARTKPSGTARQPGSTAAHDTPPHFAILADLCLCFHPLDCEGKTMKQQFAMLAAYNTWVNARLYDAV